MADDRGDEPDGEAAPLACPDDSLDGVTGQRERGEQGEQVQWAGAVPAADPGDHVSSVKVIVATHLVLCTPGAAGMIVRAG